MYANAHGFRNVEKQLNKAKKTIQGLSDTNKRPNIKVIQICERDISNEINQKFPQCEERGIQMQEGQRTPNRLYQK